MTYREEIAQLLAEMDSGRGLHTHYDIAFVRTGSFDIRVTALEPGPVRENTFDLSGGLTPKIRQRIRDWVEPRQAQVEVAVPAPVAAVPRYTKVRQMFHALEAR